MTRKTGGIRRNFRAAFRLAAMFLWSLFLLPPALTALLLPRRRRLRAGAWFTRLWAAGCRKIMSLRVKTIPAEIPLRRGGLIVANHVSYLDIFVHASLFGARFAPKIEMKRWPLVGAMTAVCNPVWIDRGNRRRAADSEREMREALLGDVPLLVYPEGTNSDGSALLPFKSTAFEAVLQSGAAKRRGDPSRRLALPARRRRHADPVVRSYRIFAALLAGHGLERDRVRSVYYGYGRSRRLRAQGAGVTAA